MSARRFTVVAGLLSLTAGCSGQGGSPATARERHDAGAVPAPDAASGRDAGNGTDVGPDLPEDVAARLRALSPATLPKARADVTNRYADDPAAAALGQKLFFDTRFSGPLLDPDNDGTPGKLGMKGDTGRVACVSCHVAENGGFLDTRTPRAQISLASGWTRRRTPSLLDFGQTSILMWDGRRDTAYNQIFGVIESPLEFNSSRLFVAQQVERYYKDEYEAVFGPMPSLSAYEPIAAADAGCAELPATLTERCPKAGQEDDAVLRILVNMGKAIAAYERLLECGSSPFDAWMHGQADALTEDEQAGAVLFVRSGCDSCHSGPHLSDQKFYNVGTTNRMPNFIPPFDDPGASAGLADAVADELNTRGKYSDGDDGRLDALPADLESLNGAFRTPTLRCAGRRASFMHAGQIRSLEDVVLFFNKGGDTEGFQGTKDPRMVPLNLTPDERRQLVAFLRALNGPGPSDELTHAPSP